MSDLVVLIKPTRYNYFIYNNYTSLDKYQLTTVNMRSTNSCYIVKR